MTNAKQPTIRIGVIGCGAIAELYHLPALIKHPQTRTAIVLAEPNAVRLEAMKAKFSASHGVTDYHDLLGKVDGVIVATPPHLHYAAAKWFLERKIHVLCEKPLTESIVEARELVEMSEQTGAKLAVNQTRRFFPTYQKIRQLIADGTLGTIKSVIYHDGVEFNWPAASPHHFQRGAKGAWSDTGVHLLDSVCFWLDAKPKLMRSFNDSCGGPESMATVQFEDRDCHIEIKISRLGRLMNGFRIIGTLGTIQAESEDWDEFTIHFKDGRRQRFKCASNRLTYLDFAHPMLENFVKVIEGKDEPTVSAASTLGTIELLEQAYQQPERYPTPWNEPLIAWRDDARYSSISVKEARRVLVTGASGFVGGRVAETMAMTELFRPTAAIRSWSRAARVAAYPMQFAICDILNPEQVDAAVSGVDAIVHCAYTDDRPSIVEGTKNLLEAAAKHGVHRFVYLSSAEVYGPDRSGTIDESIPLSPSGRAYGDAKLEAENLCRQYASRGVYASILRPSLIYGPFSDSWSQAVAKRLQSGNWGLFDNFGEGIANLVYIDDLVQSIYLCLGREDADCRTFNVNGPDRSTWNDYFKQFNEALGLPPLQRISTSKSKWRTYSRDLVRRATSTIKSRFQDQLMEIYLRGGLASRWMKRLKGELDTTPSGGELNDLYSRQANYDDRAIRETLGYKPAFNLNRGIETTIHWLLLHELIKRPELLRTPRQSTTVSKPISDAVLA